MRMGAAVRTIGTIALAAIVATTACNGGGVPCNGEITPVGEMPDLEMLVGDTVETLLAGHFGPRDCVEFARERGRTLFEATASDPAVAVSIADVTTLMVAALEVVDSARVTVAPEEENYGSQEFLVRVRRP